MTSYQPYLDFTAQSKTVSALMSLHAQLKSKEFPLTEFTPIVVFTAFAIEAYLNSIGFRHIRFWDEIERLPWKQKIEVLHVNAGATADWSQGPLQFASQVFKLREKLAHGKPERVEGPCFPNGEDAGDYQASGLMQPDWYQHITLEWTIASKSRFKELMTYLGHLYKLHPSDHLTCSTGGVRPVA